MAHLIVPTLDDEPWPTLGPQVCDFIEDRFTFGPGPLAGEPLGLVLLRQAVHEELELILVGQNAGGQQLLHQLEHGYDVPPLSQHSVDLPGRQVLR